MRSDFLFHIRTVDSKGSAPFRVKRIVKPLSRFGMFRGYFGAGEQLANKHTGRIDCRFACIDKVNKNIRTSPGYREIVFIVANDTFAFAQSNLDGTRTLPVFEKDDHTDKSAKRRYGSLNENSDFMRGPIFEKKKSVHMGNFIRPFQIGTVS